MHELQRLLRRSMKIIKEKRLLQSEFCAAEFIFVRN